MMIFIPLMGGVAVYLLVRGLRRHRGAPSARIGIVLFVVFYSAWEALFYGIGNGILAK